MNQMSRTLLITQGMTYILFLDFNQVLSIGSFLFRKEKRSCFQSKSSIFNWKVVNKQKHVHYSSTEILRGDSSPSDSPGPPILSPVSRDSPQRTPSPESPSGQIPVLSPHPHLTITPVRPAVQQIQEVSEQVTC